MHCQALQRRAMASMLAALVTVSGATSARAQPARVGEPVFELTVVAPRLVRKQAAREGATGAPVELVSLTRRVAYADLDLTLHADVQELDRRIEAVAREACEQLARVFPLSDPATPDCVAEALKGAKSQAAEAVRAAAR